MAQLREKGYEMRREFLNLYQNNLEYPERDRWMHNHHKICPHIGKIEKDRDNTVWRAHGIESGEKLPGRYQHQAQKIST